MIRTIIWFIVFWTSLVFYIPILFFVKNDRVKASFYARKWSKLLLNIAGIDLQVVGLEKLQDQESYLFVSNHQGYFDIPTLLYGLDRPLGFIAKIETKKMPLVHQWMEAIGCVFMDRGDFRQSIGAINQGADLLKEGHNMVIFPEGTRSPDGHLLPFKPGSIKMATKARVPIVPVTIDGTINIMPKDKWAIRPGRVVLYIEDPIGVDEEYFLDTKEVTKVVEGVISNRLKKQMI